MAKPLIPQPTNLISMSYQSGGLCIHNKVRELIELCMMVCKAFRNEFPEYNFYLLNIIWAEIKSLKELMYVSFDRH